MNSAYSNQDGAALITALVLLVIMTLLGLSSMRTNVMEERMAANTQESIRAFQAAESGIERALDDSATFNINNTNLNPLAGEESDFGGQGIVVDYQASFRQMTPPKRGSGWDSNYAFYHFDVTGSAVTVNGATTTVHAGAYQVGRR